MYPPSFAIYAYGPTNLIESLDSSVWTTGEEDGNFLNGLILGGQRLYDIDLTPDKPKKRVVPRHKRYGKFYVLIQKCVDMVATDEMFRVEGYMQWGIEVMPMVIKRGMRKDAPKDETNKFITLFANTELSIDPTEANSQLYLVILVGPLGE